MWNQFPLKSRPIFTNNLFRKIFIHNQSAINAVNTRNNINQRLINNLTCQRLINILPKKFHSSNTSVASNTHENITKDNKDKGTNDDNNKVIVDEQILDKLYEEMDQHIAQVNQFNQPNTRNRQYKILGLTLITIVAGVFAGAYAAHLGAWFLEQIGLFIFQEDDDD